MEETNRTTVPIVRMARANSEFRKVIMTGEKAQIVHMAIPESGERGGETHECHDQVLIFVAGTGKAKIGDTVAAVGEGQMSFVPSGAFHNFIKNGKGPLKLYTMYSPPEHEAGTEHATKAEAGADERDAKPSNGAFEQRGEGPRINPAMPEHLKWHTL